MGLKPGQTNNKDGRPKGTPNKTTKELREWVTQFLNNNLHLIENDFKRLKPIQRVIFFEKMLRYSLPTLQATSLKTDLHKLLQEARDNGTLNDEQIKKLAIMIVEQQKNINDEEQ